MCFFPLQFYISYFKLSWFFFLVCLVQSELFKLVLQLWSVWAAKIVLSVLQTHLQSAMKGEQSILLITVSFSVRPSYHASLTPLMQSPTLCDSSLSETTGQAITLLSMPLYWTSQHWTPCQGRGGGSINTCYKTLQAHLQEYERFQFTVIM